MLAELDGEVVTGTLMRISTQDPVSKDVCLRDGATRRYRTD